MDVNSPPEGGGGGYHQLGRVELKMVVQLHCSCTAGKLDKSNRLIMSLAIFSHLFEGKQMEVVAALFLCVCPAW